MDRKIDLRDYLLPYPKKVEKKDGVFNISKAKIVCDLFDSKAKLMASHIIERSKEICGFVPYIENTACNNHVICYEWDLNLDEEEYIIDVEENKVTLIASTPRARYYAAVTLLQMLDSDGNIACVHIEDKPDYKIRAISDDISRGQVSTMDHFKKIIKFCSDFKINTYFLYIEDMFQFDANPRIGIGRGALTPDEAHELVRFGRMNEVDVLPLFESLGHQMAMVEMPEYQEIREGAGSFSFNPTDHRTLQLMDTFYTELCEVFPNKILFAGLDETNDVGSGASKEYIEKYGAAKLYAEYYNALNKIAKKHGKQLWIYGTLAIDNPEALDMMDKDIVLVNYTFYWPEFGDEWWDNLYTYMPKLIEKGYSEVVSPGIWNWKMVFPEYKSSYKNISELNKAGFENKCFGTMCASWCDDGGENFREYNWYGFAMQSEISWNAENPVTEEVISPRFGQQFFGNPNVGKAVMELGHCENTFGNVLFHTLWVNQDKWEKGLDAEVKRCDALEENLNRFWDNFGRNGRNEVVRNADNLQYLEFAAKRVQYVADLTRVIDKVHNSDDKSICNSEYSELIARMLEFRNEFEYLWKNTCRIEGLDYNLNRIDNFVAKLREQIV